MSDRREGRPGRLRAAARFAWTNLDALLVVIGAAVVFALDLTSTVDPDVVGSATLALLGVIAFVLLRDRRERAPLLEFRERVDRTLGDFEDLKQLAHDALSEHSYEVISQTAEWDITTRDSVVSTVTRRVQFTRGQVSTMEDWCSGPGKLEAWHGLWRFPDQGDDEWVKAKGIHKTEVGGGIKKIFALPHEHGRTDQLEWRVERRARGRFPGSSESISVQAFGSTADHPTTIRVTWPKGWRPRAVALRYGGDRRKLLEVLPAPGDPERMRIEEEITDLSRHGVVELSWTW
jgi:hypothetical protein